jgi:hypothetical protein
MHNTTVLYIRQDNLLLARRAASAASVFRNIGTYEQAPAKRRITCERRMVCRRLAASRLMRREDSTHDSIGCVAGHELPDPLARLF